MHSLQHKIKEFKKTKNDKLGREITVALYKSLYSNSFGKGVMVSGVFLSLKQDAISIENDLKTLYNIISTDTFIEV
jgi:hypothetical protein